MEYYFWLHAIPSAIAALLIVVLAVQCRLRKLARHKLTAYAMAFFGLLGLAGFLLNGVKFSLSFSVYALHDFAGIASLLTSLAPFFIIKFGDGVFSPKHYACGYAASLFAVVALTSGLVAYAPTIASLLFPTDSLQLIQPPSSIVAASSPSPSRTTCVSREELRSVNACWVAVDGVVYDMTGMPKWSGGMHFDCKCNSEYSSSELPSTHSSKRYYGRVVGLLCS
ncbi:MAG: hypothetical protein QW343_03375 [Candidatus Norongarragalinales archaeon]